MLKEYIWSRFHYFILLKLIFLCSRTFFVYFISFANESLIFWPNIENFLDFKNIGTYLEEEDRRYPLI